MVNTEVREEGMGDTLEGEGEGERENEEKSRRERTSDIQRSLVQRVSFEIGVIDRKYIPMIMHMGGVEYTDTKEQKYDENWQGREDKKGKRASARPCYRTGLLVFSIVTFHKYQVRTQLL